MEQYNVYKDGSKVATTESKEYLFEGLQPDTSYKLGVSRVVDGVESEVATVSAMTDEEMITEEEVVVDTLSSDVSDYHTGGGYYDLPNGERVRGKDNALEVLENLSDE